MKIAFIMAHTRINAVVLFGTLKVQSFMLTEVRDCDVLIVVTSSIFLKRKDMLKDKSKTQDKFAIAFMAKKLLQCCIGAHARVHVHFLRRVCMHFNRCCEHHACAGVYVRQAL